MAVAVTHYHVVVHVLTLDRRLGLRRRLRRAEDAPLPSAVLGTLSARSVEIFACTQVACTPTAYCR